MFGVGLPGGGDIYSALIGFCFLLSLNLKLGASLARSLGWESWAVPKLRLLWPFTTLMVLVLLVVLMVGIAWLRPPTMLGQTLSFTLLAFGVTAVFFVSSSGGGVLKKLKWSTLGAGVALSVISIVLSGALFAAYFVAKYTLLIALFFLTIYSTRTR